MSKPSYAVLAILLGTAALTGAACSKSGGSGTPGAGGSAGGGPGRGGSDSPGAGGSAAGGSGASGTAGATAGTSGSAGSSAGSSAGVTGGPAGSVGTGGATGATGSGSGGTAGTAGAAGSGGDPCATAIYCDDFEKYTTAQAPGAPWARQTSAGSTVAIDTAQFHSGAKSVKFVAASGTGSKTAYIRLMSTALLPVMPNMFYGRMMFRLEAAPTGDVHWTFLEGSGLIAGQSYHALYRYGGQHPVMNGSTFVGSQLMANYETPDSYGGTGPSSDCWKHSNKVVIPTGKWSCAEWQFDGTTNTMRFWLDGAAVDTLTVAGTGEGCGHQPNNYTWTAPTFDRMDLGWESYQQDDARTIWIDDVVLSKTKIGCP